VGRGQRADCRRTIEKCAIAEVRARTAPQPDGCGTQVLGAGSQSPIDRTQIQPPTSNWNLNRRFCLHRAKIGCRTRRRTTHKARRLRFRARKIPCGQRLSCFALLEHRCSDEHGGCDQDSPARSEWWRHPLTLTLSPEGREGNAYVVTSPVAADSMLSFTVFCTFV
jgi:hypothetical protein